MIMDILPKLESLFSYSSWYRQNVTVSLSCDETSYCIDLQSRSVLASMYECIYYTQYTVYSMQQPPTLWCSVKSCTGIYYLIVTNDLTR